MNQPTAEMQEATIPVLTHTFHLEARVVGMPRILECPAIDTDLQPVQFLMAGANTVQNRILSQATLDFRGND